MQNLTDHSRESNVCFEQPAYLRRWQRGRLPAEPVFEAELLGDLLAGHRYPAHPASLGPLDLEPEDYAHPVHAAVFSAIREVEEQGQGTDPATVAAAMRAAGTSGVLVAHGGDQVLRDLEMLARGDAGRARHRATKIRLASLLRQRSEVVHKDTAEARARLAELDTRIAAYDAPWGEPEPLRQGLRPVPPMAPDMLPPALAPWLIDCAELTGCPLDYPAVAAIVAAASTIGRKITIRPKSKDPWAEVPNLWGLLIGPPGVRKTDALDKGTAPLSRLAATASKERAQALADDAINGIVREAQRADFQKGLKELAVAAAAAANAKDTAESDRLKEEIAKKKEDAAKELPALPPERRYIVADTTIEKLMVVHSENPNGLLYRRDEMGGLFAAFHRAGHDEDRHFYLTAWKGNTEYVRDTKSGGTVRIDGLCLSLIGTIQPGPVTAMVRSLAGTEAEHDGLLQRFQVAVYPDTPRRPEVDRWQAAGAKDRAFDIFAALDRLDPADLAAEQEDGGLPFVRFTPEGAQIAKDYRDEIARKVADPAEHPLIVAHLAKFNSLHPSLALIFHLIAVVDGRADGWPGAESARLAVLWCTYLEAHARRIYAMGLGEDTTPARLLGERIQAGDLADHFTARDVYRHEWAGLADRGVVQAALDELVEAGWLRPSRAIGRTGGRPTTKYAVNPSLGNRPRNRQKGVDHV